MKTMKCTLLRKKFTPKYSEYVARTDNSCYAVQITIENKVKHRAVSKMEAALEGLGYTTEWGSYDPKYSTYPY